MKKRERVSRFLKEQLARGERVEKLWRRHWFWLVRQLFWTAIVLLGAILAFAVVEMPFEVRVASLAIPLSYMVIVIIGWWKRQLVLTNQRVLLLGGFFNFLNRPDDLPLNQIGNVDQEGLGFFKSVVGEVEIKIQSGDIASGVFAKNFPTDAVREIRSAQSGLMSVFHGGQTGEELPRDLLGR